MLERVNNMIWGNGLVFLLLFTGVLYTFKLRFIQIRILPKIIKKSSSKIFRGKYLRTMCMSLGAAMGTGNIVGVASAIAIGGAGAVFWMWVSAFSGMATVYAENTLSMKYSDKLLKGPMAYIQKGLGSRVLAVFFAFCCILASFGMGGMAQICTMSESILSCIDVDRVILSFIIFAAVFSVISGGAQRIGKAAQVLLPLAAIVYSSICVILIFQTRNMLPAVIKSIFCEAFGIRQAFGGLCGHTVMKSLSAGIRRGVFSNEAGLGSSPLLHSSDDSASYAFCAMIEVFVDTIVCCTLTAVTLLCSSEDISIRSAFAALTGEHTDTILAVIMTIFAFCTVIGWYYCGETAFVHVFPNISAKKYAFSFAFFAALGAIIKSEYIWTLSDIFNGSMAFPNILALIFLSRQVHSE